jgi:hypothetical protein
MDAVFLPGLNNTPKWILSTQQSYVRTNSLPKEPNSLPHLPCLLDCTSVWDIHAPPKELWQTNQKYSVQLKRSCKTEIPKIQIETQLGSCVMCTLPCTLVTLYITSKCQSSSWFDFWEVFQCVECLHAAQHAQSWQRLSFKTNSSDLEDDL